MDGTRRIICGRTFLGKRQLHLPRTPFGTPEPTADSRRGQGEWGIEPFDEEKEDLFKMKETLNGEGATSRRHARTTRQLIAKVEDGLRCVLQLIGKNTEVAYIPPASGL